MKLKKLRKRLGLSMRGLAKLTGISRQSILNYEKGRCTPGSVYWEILQRRLNITESYKRFWGKKFTERGRPRKYDKVACRYPHCRQRPASRGLCTVHYGMVRNRLLSVAPSWGPEAEEILKKLTMSKNTTLPEYDGQIFITDPGKKAAKIGFKSNRPMPRYRIHRCVK